MTYAQFFSSLTFQFVTFFNSFEQLFWQFLCTKTADSKFGQCFFQNIFLLPDNYIQYNILDFLNVDNSLEQPIRHQTNKNLAFDPIAGIHGEQSCNQFEPVKSLYIDISQSVPLIENNFIYTLQSFYWMSGLQKAHLLCPTKNKENEYFSSKIILISILD